MIKALYIILTRPGPSALRPYYYYKGRRPGGLYRPLGLGPQYLIVVAAGHNYKAYGLTYSKAYGLTYSKAYGLYGLLKVNTTGQRPV